MKRVKLNARRCEKVAGIIKTLKFRDSFYQGEYTAIHAEPETKMRAYIYSIAICHQTHTLVSKRRNLVGWDYLKFVFTDLMRKNSELLDPKHLASLTANELSERLRLLFSDDGKPEKCTLDRLEERSNFMIDISRVLNEKYDGKIGNLVKSSNGFLIKNGKGLYELLEAFEAYTDPLRKKSTVFLKKIMEAGLFQPKDPDNIVPIMDYHMQRALLRIGCVEITEKELKRKLANKVPMKSDEEIRNASVEAMKLMSRLSGHPILKMNDLFWSLGRSCCKEKVLCMDGKCNKDPCTLYLTVDLKSHDDCIFNGTCKGSKDAEYRKLWQPIVDTHYY
ncbi:hypothetical protein A3K63_04720 [Candidatus Micrarchaeota archaeon RBG_16_49_10]|nr:MAG: hypothetical protein A3K63_04720 [Candidatus Micrarchaeota archaeon RBG_16_49_10]